MTFRRWRAKKSEDLSERAIDTPQDQVGGPTALSQDEGTARKRRSEAFVRSLGVQVNDHLPTIETEAESTRRDVKDVAERAIALMAVAVKAEGHSTDTPEAVREYMTPLIEQYRLDGRFTPDEQAFVEAFDPERGDWVQFLWRYEACWVMHWALGFVECLDPPTNPCDAAATVRQIHDRGREGYLSEARLRPQAEILDEADTIYRFHWAARNAGLSGRQVDGIDLSVTMERHYALNWLIGYADEEWDDISTDT